ncbi:MAG: OpgC domain-containing protein [Rhodospirillaceae bacterium]|nr:OpgC domain-containing protein [Rhodospirillaceae bacterium]
MSGPQRDWRIDFWRGLAVLMIFVNHIPDNICSLATSRNFGLSDAAELFVFLSGFSLANAFTSRFAQRRVMSLYFTSKRLVSLYLNHLAMFLGLAAICAIFLDVTGADTLIHEMLFDPFFAETQLVMTKVLTLTYLPTFLDILPLYICLTLFGGVMFVIFGRNWPPYLLVSAFLYVWALRSGFNFPSYPADRFWFFNPLAWQFVFVCGFVAALVKDEAWFMALRNSPLIMSVAIAMLLFGLVGAAPWAYQSLIIDWKPLDPFVAPLVDKQNLSPLRVFHFLSVAFVFAALVPHAASWGRSAPARAVGLIGRQSLVMFVTCTILSAIAGAVLRVTGGHWQHQVAATMLGILILVGLALALSKAEERLAALRRQ